jgi:hypothetical protein
MKNWSLGLFALLFGFAAAMQAQTLQFSSQGYTVGEEQAFVTLTVVKSGTAAGPVTVHYATMDESGSPFATASADYVATQGDLTFAPNETTKTFQVAIKQDANYEESEVFHVVLDNATGGAAVGEPSRAQVTIVDDDPIPRVQFSATNYSVNENAGTASLVITKTGATEVPATVYYKTRNGTATAPSDYTFTGDDLTASVRFEPSENTKQIAIPIQDDGYREPNETFEVYFTYFTASYPGTPATATVTIIDDDPQGAPPPAKTLNLSTRASVQAGDRIMIGGFIITGSEEKRVLIRGLGPSLAQAGVPTNAVLLDPVLRLNKADGSFIDFNDNWREWLATERELEGTAFQPKDDREAAMLDTLLPGAYTVWVVGKNQTQGIGLFEVYDFDANGGAELANLSTRGYVGMENDVMIGGFTLGAESGTVQIAIRGLGPSLAGAGVHGVLPDPAIELHDSNGAGIASNDDWQSDPVSATQLTAHGLALPDSKEAGLFVALAPGTYTAILNGKSVNAGIGLVEVYNLK